MKKSIIEATFLSVVMMGLASPMAVAEEYPSKAIKFVIPYPAGGTSDTLGRLVADGMAKQLQQPVVVENRPGAATVIGVDHLVKAAADGYTVLLTSPAVAINASMRASLPYKTQDIQHISTVAELPMAIFAHGNGSLSTVSDIVEAARKNPGTITYGTAGTGSTGHLTMKLVEHLANVELLHVPFQGSAPSVNAAAGNHVQLAVDTVYLGKPMIDAGKLKGVVAFGEQRSSILPETPTAPESGLPKLVSTAWYAIAVKQGTPPDRVAKLNAAITETLAQPAVRESMLRMGLEIIGDTSDESEARFQSELEKMAEAVRLSGEKIL